MLMIEETWNRAKEWKQEVENHQGNAGVSFYRGENPTSVMTEDVARWNVFMQSLWSISLHLD